MPLPLLSVLCGVACLCVWAMCCLIWVCAAWFPYVCCPVCAMRVCAVCVRVSCMYAIHLSYVFHLPPVCAVCGATMCYVCMLCAMYELCMCYYVCVICYYVLLWYVCCMCVLLLSYYYLCYPLSNLYLSIVPLRVASVLLHCLSSVSLRHDTQYAWARYGEIPTQLPRKSMFLPHYRENLLSTSMGDW